MSLKRVRTLLVALVSVLLLAGCSDDPAPAPQRATPSTSLVATVPCAPDQIAAGSGDGRATFTVVNQGPSCLLRPRDVFAAVGGEVVSLGHSVTLPTDTEVTVQVRGCDTSGRVVAPLLFGIRTTPTGRTETLVRAVAGTEGSRCSGHRLAVIGEPRAARAVDSPVRAPRLALQRGLPASDHSEPSFLVGRGAQLPLFCGEVWSRYGAGLVLRRTVDGSMPRGGSVDRQVDAYRDARHARRAYQLLRESNRRCPQRGQVGFTARRLPAPYGRGSWALSGVDVGTGAGYTRTLWLVVRRGRQVVMSVSTGAARRSEQARFARILER